MEAYVRIQHNGPELSQEPMNLHLQYLSAILSDNLESL